MSKANKISELGTLLINLEKESNPNKKKLIYLICLVLVAISFYFNNYSGFVAIALFGVLEVVEIQKYKKYGRGLYTHGICFNGTITEWSKIKSYEWVDSKEHGNYGVLKLTKHKNILSGIELPLPISDNQKEEVDKILRKSIRKSPKKKR